MLKICQSLHTLDFGKLMQVYAESNSENAREFYPDEETNIAILKVEQSFYQYLKEDFFTVQGAFYAVWEQGSAYVCALRLEPYRDGLLLEALETALIHRRKGYAANLINAVMEHMKRHEIKYIYSHVNKKNLPSLKTHLSCGFERVLDHAVYIDGSVMQNSCTLRAML